MTKKKTIGSNSQLPNAPLVEVIFELRWGLEGDISIPPPPLFRSDPGYPILVDNFVTTASKHDFKAIKKVGQEGMLSPHSIGLRLYKSENQPFPLWQIGPGIFASNESAAYEWKTFKKLTLDGAKVLFSSYPKMKSFGLKPNYLELRYIDSFDSSYTSHQNVVRFINEQTFLNIKIPSFLSKKPIGESSAINLVFDFPVTNMKDTVFRVRIANGRVKDSETILLISKVFTRSDTINIGSTVANRIQYLKKWLESAHAVTSPFFKQFVDEALMVQFRRIPNASN